MTTEAPTFEIELADMLRKARRAAKLQQGEIAQKLGVSRPLVSLWENGHATPHLDQYVQFAKLCDADWLLDLKRWTDLGVLFSRCSAGFLGQTDWLTDLVAS